ncbi:GH1 family beta-glucosidase [Vallitalea okinawensis]|uniref:GH1 family beta-glucosidase n=1 Tax=Vallitalea okinawensis TaxID=2078660 RepID=UPI000CFD4E3F|nr:GH1 family beta-glucosidase [Vallitalea okinawensis]
MFNKDFLWGAATASYQVEGAAYDDGKGLSVWDMYTRQEDKVYNMDNGDFACDSYNNIEDDVRILKELGVKAYRFSISWPRVIPNGIGRINEKGLTYYDQFVDALLEADIEPYVTLFHWDYPYELYKKGQWLNDESSNWFEEYARVVVTRLGDRVKNWMTINEPQCFIGLGYFTGIHAPGHQYSKFDIIRMTHNTLLAHGKAVKVIREIVGKEARVGFAFVATIGIPNTLSEDDIEAARDFMFNPFEKTKDHKEYNFPFDNDYWYDPILLGKYPDWVMNELRDYLPSEAQLEEDFKLITEEVDFIGLNIYQGPRVEKDGEYIKVSKLPSGHAVTGLNWLVSEEIMYWGTKFMYERYKKPIYITENGLSNKDWVALDGKVHDEGRIDFLNRYLLQLERAHKEGIDIRGYFQWSLFDNFEWAEGYKDRFGLVHVDFETGTRTPKESYYWYRDLIKE